METVGDYLKKQREAKNISLRKVSHLTKISEFYLDCLEKDDYEKLPQGPYIKGYISSYATLIGGNAEEALRLYASVQKHRAHADELSPKKPKENGKRGAISSSSKAKIFQLKSAVPSSQKIAALLQSTSVSIKKAASKVPKVTFSSKSISFSLKKVLTSIKTLSWLFDKRIWLFGSLAILSSCILILAGFGFYHLFLYQKNPPALADRQVPQDRVQQTTLAANTAENKALILPLERPAGLESLSPMISSPTRAVSQPASGAKDSGAASKSLAKTEDSVVAIPSSLVASLSDQITPTKATREPLHDTTGLDRPAPESLSGDLNLKALKAAVGSDVKEKMPVGVSNSFSWSTDRVYVWSLIQCKNPPSSIRHIYYFKGEKLSDVHLSVQSFHWRTWSYKSLSNRNYIGPWRVDIASAEGKVFRSLYFEVK
jgi:hypothetical protein